MTYSPSQIDALSLDELRIAVAEAQGWKMVEGMLAFPPMWWLKERVPLEILETIACVDYMPIPEYSTSHDALVPGLASMTEGRRADFEQWLLDDLKIVSVPHACLRTGSLLKLITATPEQKCRAYLKAIQ